MMIQYNFFNKQSYRGIENSLTLQDLPTGDDDIENGKCCENIADIVDVIVEIIKEKTQFNNNVYNLHCFMVLGNYQDWNVCEKSLYDASYLSN